MKNKWNMRLGAVHLTVNDLGKLLVFYQNYVGLQLHWREGQVAALGVGKEDLLVLHESPKAVRPELSTDIYHFALYMPNRHTLAKAIARLMALRHPNYPTDHLVSETVYFEDPEENTVELTFETPERGDFVFPEDGTMPYALGTDGKRYSGRDPIDMEELFSLLQPDDDLNFQLPEEVRVHHVHLYVSSMEKARRFYRDIIGFREKSFAPIMGMADMGPEGYPVHMLAYNVWKGEYIPDLPKNAIGLKYFTVILSQAQLSEVISRLELVGTPVEKQENGVLVYDPSGLGVLLTQQPAQ